MQGSLRGNAGPRYRHTADESAPYEIQIREKRRPRTTSPVTPQHG